jgi:hypothetical protein
LRKLSEYRREGSVDEPKCELQCDIPRRGDGRQLHFRSSGALSTADIFSSSNITTTTAIPYMETGTPVIQSELQVGSSFHHRAGWTIIVLPGLARSYHHSLCITGVTTGPYRYSLSVQRRTVSCGKAELPAPTAHIYLLARNLHLELYRQFSMTVPSAYMLFFQEHPMVELFNACVEHFWHVRPQSAENWASRPLCHT